MDSKKAVALYFSVAALSMSVVACSGFKAKIEDQKIGGSVQVLTPRDNGGGSSGDTYIAPIYPIQINNATPIIDFMASQNQNVMAILNDPNFMGPPYIAGKMSIILKNLSPNNSVSAGIGSEIRFQGILSGATGVEIRLESTDARLYLDTSSAVLSSGPHLTGYWAIPSSAGRVTLAVDAHLVRDYVSTTGNYRFQGTLYGSFGGAEDSQALGTFEIPACAVVTDTSWSQELTLACAEFNP